MEKAENFDVTSKISTLKLINFKVEKFAFETKIDPNSIVFEYSVNVKLEKTTGIISINCNTKLYNDQQKSQLLGSIATHGDFEILN